MTPAELLDACDLLGRVVAAHGVDEERAVAADLLREIRGLLRDVRSGADDVDLGRRTPVVKPSLTLMKLQVLAPKGNGGALDGMLRCVEAQEGTRGRREITPITFVFDDGAWSDVLLPSKPQDAGFQSFRRELTPSTF